MLDLYGTNHHGELWERPNEFIPERFKDRDKNLFDFIPQGGGEYIAGHRCPGERLTMKVMTRCLDILVNKMNYTVPKQNLGLRMNQMPSVPESGFIMKHVQK